MVVAVSAIQKVWSFIVDVTTTPCLLASLISQPITRGIPGRTSGDYNVESREVQNRGEGLGVEVQANRTLLDALLKSFDNLKT